MAKVKKKTKLDKKKNNKPTWKPKKGIPSRFPKGTSGNPNGRPKGSKNKISVAELMEAIHQVEKKEKKSLLKHFVERAYAEDSILVALMKKILPDLRSIEGMITTVSSSMDDEVASAIQKKLREQWLRKPKK